MNVQRGSTTLMSTCTAVTISAVDVSSSFVHATFDNSESIRVELSDPCQITFVRSGSCSGHVNASWQVVELPAGSVTIERFADGSSEIRELTVEELLDRALEELR